MSGVHRKGGDVGIEGVDDVGRDDDVERVAGVGVMRGVM
jgi:hypothetical protein